MGVLQDHGLDEASVPWWALAALDLKKGTDEHRTRRVGQSGKLIWISRSKEILDQWRVVVDQARKFEAIYLSPENLVSEDVELARHAALSCPRAFHQLAGILDDTNRVPLFKDFHVRCINHLRQQQYSLELLPFAHGKSWIANISVPLMDWAEEPEFTQGRIFYNDKFKILWARKLMWNLEHNLRLRTLFPWVQRPSPENPIKAWWSTQGFAIEGKRSMEPSWEGFGANAGITGRRYWRTICDDWVVSEVSGSQVVMDKFWDYFHTGPMSMQKPVPWRSHYGTRTPSLGVVGTLFKKMDFNYRLAQNWRELGYPVSKVDVYTDKSCTQVIWPEERPLEFIEGLKKSMGDIAFRLRCRNLVQEDGDMSFKEADVDRAFRPDFNAGDTLGLPCLVGFDPASGKRGKQSKYPAAVLLAFEGDKIHVVRWARWEFAMPAQVNALAQWAHLYGCPIAVEDNNQQTAYSHWMKLQYPDVRVFSHTTTNNKRDWMQGVESLIPFFEQGNIIIHAGGVSDTLKRALRDELVMYPDGKFSDLVMALWIAKEQYRLKMQRFEGKYDWQKPMYASKRGRSTIINLKAIREAKYNNGGWTQIPGSERPA